MSFIWINHWKTLTLIWKTNHNHNTLLTGRRNLDTLATKDVASHADVILAGHTQSFPMEGTRDETLRTSTREATWDVAVYANAYYAHFLTKIYHLQIELKIALSTNSPISFFLFKSLVVAPMVLC